MNTFYTTPSMINNKCIENVTYCNNMACKIELAVLQAPLQGPTPAGHVLHLIDREKTALM